MLLLPMPRSEASGNHTLFAKVEGVIKFEVKGAFGRRYVSIVPKAVAA
jgi:large subunit ribosomal protein L27